MSICLRSPTNKHALYVVMLNHWQHTSSSSFFFCMALSSNLTLSAGLLSDMPDMMEKMATRQACIWL